MIKVVCENCKIEIEIPDHYNAPYIQCPDCGTLQKLKVDSSKELKFKILDAKGRERAANNVVGEEYIEEAPQNKPKFSHPPKSQSVPMPDFKFEKESSSPVIDQKQLILDSIGEEGLKKAYHAVAKYINQTSEKARKNGKAKAIQIIMKEKVPVELATKAIEYAEKAPETLELAKNNKNKIIIIIAIVAVILIAILGIVLILPSA